LIVGCGDLTILLVGLGFHCFLLKCKEKLRHSLGRPSRSDFVQPEVLGEMKDIPKPDVSNEESVREYFCKIKTRSEMIAEMPDNVIPMNFHLYEIRIGDDSLEMEIDYIWNIFGISYSGNKKVMKQFEKISKDLYIYYGVSEDDIKKKTERYLSLVTALSS